MKIALGLVVAVLMMFGVLQTHSASAQENDGTQLFFEETGQVLADPFLSAYTPQGGMDSLGNPVTPPTKIGNVWAQWFEFGRLEIPADMKLADATKDDVQRSPIGLQYAEKSSFMRSRPAFQPVQGAGDGAEYFADTQHSVANGFLDLYNRGKNADFLGDPISEEFAIRGEVYQFFQYGAISWKDEQAQIVPLGTMDAILNNAWLAPITKTDQMDTYNPNYFVTSPSYGGERWIDINLSNYTLTAYAGDQPVISTPIVSGKPGTPTVTGEFAVRTKLQFQDMEGDNLDGTRYTQADVPNVMYFYQDWAIHGAYWRYSFGHSGSHGCVNLPVSVSTLLFDFASIGTRVSVHY